MSTFHGITQAKVVPQVKATAIPFFQATQAKHSLNPPPRPLAYTHMATPSPATRSFYRNLHAIPARALSSGIQQQVFPKF